MPGTDMISSSDASAWVVSIIGITAMSSRARSYCWEPVRIDTTVGPHDLVPSGGYRHERTTDRASSALLTIGTMMPWAPASRTLPMMPGSFHGTRAMGWPPPARMAWIIPTPDR